MLRSLRKYVQAEAKSKETLVIGDKQDIENASTIDPQTLCYERMKYGRYKN